MSSQEQHVIFRSIDEMYALNIKHIQEIIKMKEICEIPNSARSYIKGVINVRGIIIPVISLSERFGNTQPPETRTTRIIITKVQEQFIGIIVDEIIKVEFLSIEPLPETVNEEIKTCSLGFGYMGNKIIPILELLNVLEIGSEIK